VSQRYAGGFPALTATGVSAKRAEGIRVRAACRFATQRLRSASSRARRAQEIPEGSLVIVHEQTTNDK